MSARRGVPVWAVILTAALAVVVVVVVVVGVAVAHRSAPEAVPAVQTSPASAAPIGPAPQVTSAPAPSAEAASPVSVATGFVSAFTNRGLTGAAWEKAYDAYLSADAQQAYHYTLKSNVPGTKVTGTAVLTAGGTTTGTSGTADAGDTDPAPAIVTVPTDAGSYTVDLQRRSGTWQVLSAQTPGEN